MKYKSLKKSSTDEVLVRIGKVLWIFVTIIISLILAYPMVFSRSRWDKLR